MADTPLPSVPSFLPSLIFSLRALGVVACSWSQLIIALLGYVRGSLGRVALAFLALRWMTATRKSLPSYVCYCALRVRSCPQVAFSARLGVLAGAKFGCLIIRVLCWVSPGDTIIYVRFLACLESSAFLVAVVNRIVNDCL